MTSGLDLVVVLTGAAILALALLSVRGVFSLLPVAKSTRDAVRRSLPIAAAGATLVYALVAVSLLFADQPLMASIAALLVLGAFMTVSWGALRDLASGVFLKAGDICQTGDHVRIDDLQGRIMHMGLRVLVLETSDGDEALIPYSRIARDRLLRTPAVEGVTPHVFQIRVPPGLSPAELKARVRRSAMLIHWSAVSRAPEMALHEGQLEVTVYAVDPDRGPDIERAVRRALKTEAAASPLDEEAAG